MGVYLGSGPTVDMLAPRGGHSVSNTDVFEWDGLGYTATVISDSTNSNGIGAMTMGGNGGIVCNNNKRLVRLPTAQRRPLIWRHHPISVINGEGHHRTISNQNYHLESGVLVTGHR